MRTNEKKSSSSGERPDLDRRYGAIGISAVAAAVRYQGEARQKVTEPVAAQTREEREEVAA